MKQKPDHPPRRRPAGREQPPELEPDVEPHH